MSGGQDPDQWNDLYDPDSLTLQEDFDHYLDFCWLAEFNFDEGGEG